MTKMEKAIILDNILRSFTGNIAYTWDQLHDEGYFKKIHNNYFVVENNINYLLGDGKLERRKNMEKKILDGHYRNVEVQHIGLTDVGFAVLTDFENLGYVSKEKERLSTQSTNIIIAACTIGAAILGLITLIHQIVISK